jgi:hypothetical protein
MGFRSPCGAGALIARIAMLRPHAKGPAGDKNVTISPFNNHLKAADEAIAQTIENDSGLRRKRDLLLSISGVGEILAGVVLAELPDPDVLRSSAAVVAYAGLNPRTSGVVTGTPVYLGDSTAADIDRRPRLRGAIVLTHRPQTEFLRNDRPEPSMGNGPVQTGNPPLPGPSSGIRRPVPRITCRSIGSAFRRST